MLSGGSGRGLGVAIKDLATEAVSAVNLGANNAPGHHSSSARFPDLSSLIAVCSNEHRFLAADQLQQIDVKALVKILEPSHHPSVHAAVLGPSVVKHRRAHGVLAAQIKHGSTSLGLLQNTDDLAVDASGLLHLESPVSNRPDFSNKTCPHIGEGVRDITLRLPCLLRAPCMHSG